MRKLSISLHLPSLLQRSYKRGETKIWKKLFFLEKSKKEKRRKKNTLCKLSCQRAVKQENETLFRTTISRTSRLLDCPRQRQYDETIAKVRFTSVLQTYSKCSGNMKVKREMEWPRWLLAYEPVDRRMGEGIIKPHFCVPLSRGQRIRNKRLSYKLRWYLPRNSVPLESLRTEPGERSKIGRIRENENGRKIDRCTGCPTYHGQPAKGLIARAKMHAEEGKWNILFRSFTLLNSTSTESISN